MLCVDYSLLPRKKRKVNTGADWLSDWLSDACMGALKPMSKWEILCSWKKVSIYANPYQRVSQFWHATVKESVPSNQLWLVSYKQFNTTQKSKHQNKYLILAPTCLYGIKYLLENLCWGLCLTPAEYETQVFLLSEHASSHLAFCPSHTLKGWRRTYPYCMAAAHPRGSNRSDVCSHDPISQQKLRYTWSLLTSDIHSL